MTVLIQSPDTGRIGPNDDYPITVDGMGAEPMKGRPRPSLVFKLAQCGAAPLSRACVLASSDLATQ